MMSKYLVIDIEVSADHTWGRFANPLDARNEITSIAALSHSGKYFVKHSIEGIARNIPLKLENYDLIIGQNIKFDLLYLWSNENLQNWLKRGGIIWDTMLAEYLLSGQQIGHNDLDSLSEMYGGTAKDPTIGQMFKDGLKAKDIDKELLLKYNKKDVENTEKVFKEQYKIARKEGMLPLLAVYMRHLLAITEMEYNGMAVDVVRGHSISEAIVEKIKELEVKFKNALATTFNNDPDYCSLSINSAKQISTLFFGGEIKKVVAGKTGVFFKTGKHKGEEKTKNVTVVSKLLGLQVIPKVDWAGKVPGVYSVDDEVLTNISRSYPKYSHLIGIILSYREQFKLLSTYYYLEHYDSKGNVKKVTGILSLVHPQRKTLHCEFKPARTVTGRLSSIKPNSQNLPASILDIFVSRYPGGSIIEIDFSQLEICIQAYLAQCSDLIRDIEEGVDMHRLRLAYALDLSYEEVGNLPDFAEKRRSIAKPISFQKAYGAFPDTVAERANLPLDMVKQVFDKEDEDYPEIAQFYKLVLEEVQKSRVPTTKKLQIKNKKTGKYFTTATEKLAYGTYRSLTGKKYTFFERATLGRDRSIFRYFKMTEIQNYPVQGFAADLVAMQVGEVFKELLTHRDKCVIINEVHDSLILDCMAEYKGLIIDKVSEIMNNTKNNLKKYFGLELNVPIKVDVKTGATWANCKEG